MPGTLNETLSTGGQPKPRGATNVSVPGETAFDIWLVLRRAAGLTTDPDPSAKRVAEAILATHLRKIEKPTNVYVIMARAGPSVLGLGFGALVSAAFIRQTAESLGHDVVGTEVHPLSLAERSA